MIADWIDITRVLSDSMTTWPGDPPFRLERVADIADGGAMVTEIRTSAHIGTHLDAPLHCLAGGDDVASVPLQRLCGPAVVVDAVGRGGVVPADLQAVDLRRGDRVLLKVDGEDEGVPPAFVTVEAARWLIEQGAVLLGVDIMSPDPPEAHDLPAHHALLGASVPILEGLDLRRVKPGRYEMVALPLPIRGCEASPARVILRAADGM